LIGRFGISVLFLGWPFLLGAIFFQTLRYLIPILVASNHHTLVFWIVGSFVFVVSLVAYRLRCAARRFYALTEIGFGIGTSLFAGSALLTTTELTQENIWQIYAPLMAGVYVCVRGLSNLEDALWSKPVPEPANFTQRFWHAAFYKNWLFWVLYKGFGDTLSPALRQQIVVLGIIQRLRRHFISGSAAADR
jgi:hypothetical protein